jgi:membrane-bound lytic murein transglycosylase A
MIASKTPSNISLRNICFTLALGFLLSVNLSCHYFSQEENANQTAMLPDSLVLGTGRRLPHMLPIPPDSIGPLDFNPDFSQALVQQTLYLLRSSIRPNPIRGITQDALLKTVQNLQNWPYLTPEDMYTLFDFYQIQTTLYKEKVRITGYYTPTIEARKKKTGAYQVPLYKRPKNWNTKVPNTREIYAGALNGQGLEIAWCKTQKQVRDAQLQGSCVLQYPDGTSDYLGFDGTNKSVLKNQADSTQENPQSIADLGDAYVFFQVRDHIAWGAAGFPITQGYSIAVDQHVIPLGACLLARIPLRDSTGQTKHVYRIVMAQDMGASVKSTGHIDLYCGAGDAGRQKVNTINGYGNLWLLLPKKEEKTEQQPNKQ